MPGYPTLPADTDRLAAGLIYQGEVKTAAIKPKQPEPPASTNAEFHSKLQKSASILFTASVSNGNIEKVEELLAKGADADAVDKSGRPLLITACGNGDVEMARLLVKSGANLLARDTSGVTALHAVADNGSGKCAACLDFLLDNAQVTDEIDVQECTGSTPLILAAKHGSPETIEKLIKAGASVNFVDGTQETALEHAARHERAKVVEVLTGMCTPSPGHLVASLPTLPGPLFLPGLFRPAFLMTPAATHIVTRSFPCSFRFHPCPQRTAPKRTRSGTW